MTRPVITDPLSHLSINAVAARPTTLSALFGFINVGDELKAISVDDEEMYARNRTLIIFFSRFNFGTSGINQAQNEFMNHLRKTIHQ